MAAMRGRTVGKLISTSTFGRPDVPRRVMANLSMKPTNTPRPQPQTEWLPTHTDPYFYHPATRPLPPPPPPAPPYHTLRARSSTTPGSTVNHAASAQRTTPHLGGGYFLTYHDLERALERRGLSVLRFLMGMGAVLATGTALMWPRIKRWGAAEGAEVAAQSLQADELKVHAAALINALINEPSTMRNLEDALKSSVTNLLDDAELKHALTSYMADVMAEAILWPKVLERGNMFVGNMMENEESIENAKVYFSKAAQRAVADTDVQDAASRALWSSVKRFFVRSTPATTTTELQAADEKSNVDSNKQEITVGNENPNTLGETRVE